MAADFAAERDWKLESSRQCAALSAACQGVPKVREEVALQDRKNMSAAVAAEIAAFWEKAWDRARDKSIPPAAGLVPESGESESGGEEGAAAVAEELREGVTGVIANGSVTSDAAASTSAVAATPAESAAAAATATPTAAAAAAAVAVKVAAAAAAAVATVTPPKEAKAEAAAAAVITAPTPGGDIDMLDAAPAGVTPAAVASENGGAMTNGSAVLEAGPGIYCSPRQRMPFN
jgi:hypothetical protein